MKTKFIRCRLQKQDGSKNPRHIRDWIIEKDASLMNIIRDKDGSSWKIVSIDRGTFVERVV